MNPVHPHLLVNNPLWIAVITAQSTAQQIDGTVNSVLQMAAAPLCDVT